MPIPSGSADQGTLPLIGLDDELSALREEVARLRAENARLLRLLELTAVCWLVDGRRLAGVSRRCAGVFDGSA